MEGGPRLIAGACMGALIACWAPGSTAQTMYKCVDDQRRVTYSNIRCEKQGLKDAGQVADRTTTVPLGPAQKAPPPRERTAVPAPDTTRPKSDADVDTAPPAQIKPINPLIERLLK